MAALMPLGKQQYFAASGAPLVGGKVYTYAAGTTTPLATYTDSSGSTPNANPVVLDSRGEASIFFSAASYKIVLKDSADVTIWTQDNLAGDAAASAMAALAASGGSALVGYIQSGTGAVATTVQAKLRESVSVKDFGADPTGVADSTTAIQNALNSGAKVVNIPAGTYKITTGLVAPSGVSVIGEGNATVLDATSIADSATVLSESGSVSATTTLTGDVALYARSITVTSATGISAGTWLFLKSTLDNSWSGFRTYRKQSFYQVVSVSGTTVELSEPVCTTFQSASTTVLALSTATAVFQDFKVLTKSTGSTASVGVTYGKDFVIQNVHSVGADSTGIGVTNSIHSVISDCTSFLTATAVDTQYAVAVNGSDFTTVINCDLYGTRHAVAVVGDQCRRTRVINSRLKAGTRAADAHGCTDDLLYQDCLIDGGITFGGRDVSYKNCEIVGNDSNGIVVLSADIYGGTFSIENCTATTTSASITAGWSPVDLGRGTAAITTDSRQDCTFRFLDSTFNVPNLATYFTRVQNTSAYKVNFDVRGLTINYPNMVSVVRYEGAPSGSDADFVIVDDITTNAVAATLPLFQQGSAATGYTTTKMRMQSCSKTRTANYSSAAASVTDTFSFPYTYPKTPATIFTYVGPKNPSGTAGREIYSSITAQSATSATVTLTTISGGTFAVTSTGDINYQVGINEI